MRLTSWSVLSSHSSQVKQALCHRFLASIPVGEGSPPTSLHYSRWRLVGPGPWMPPQTQAGAKAWRRDWAGATRRARPFHGFRRRRAVPAARARGGGARQRTVGVCFGPCGHHAADREGAPGPGVQPTDDKRLSDYNIGPNSKLNLVVKPLEKVLLEEGSAHRLVDSPPPPLWQLISKVLARHFSVADASRVLEQLQRDYDRSLSRLTLDDIERLASRFLHPEVTESMEKGFSK
ncbi:ubiquitin-like protein 4A isoform X2 [Mesocricetus auratus]|uniref:Ubiquitin-like protein 4A isoform X2 n=1 Tax=Mesocricetus auratus TaxID=10036 RepID=A0ABM2XD62_MESAU|nr:ubiquitin-like protein 4A isoform X2 [Mesocricetus auratus]